ncbi:hypothetical protein FAGAP_516 [Fusarium agapanthi]|uniref:Uncharacterized protein n=1 Tax=Fusarium agapanthi TaxID=1803897 RepID=A0A9P5BJ86_9HYPO|nr:hypothetical protein FAGAP_516 [Fusarium agapanthi]
MSSKADIQTQIALLGRQMEELEKEIKVSAPYTEYVKEQMVIHHATMDDSDDEAMRDLAWKNYEFYCGVLEKLIEKEEVREDRMRELRDAERTLSMSLQSAQ